jgi:hypothetical protein
MLITTMNNKNDVKYVLNKIAESMSFGIFKEEIDVIIQDCKKINKKDKNQYFNNIISDLETRFIYSIDDIYVIEDLVKIRSYLSTR